jgi:GxxExxY protein
MTELIHSNLTHDIIGAAMEVHTRLGAGFLESVYEEAMAYELELRHIEFERQKEVDVYYKDRLIKQFVCDFMIAGLVIVELKAIKTTGEIERAQVLNYLKATHLPLALLINFGALSLEFHRFANTVKRI